MEEIDTRIATKKLNEKYGSEWTFNIIEKTKEYIRGEIKVLEESFDGTANIADSFRNGCLPVNSCFLKCYKKIKNGGGFSV